ncbi:MAG: hypothetical protein ACKV1O_30900 [Saprospiraceae bacterium]
MNAIFHNDQETAIEQTIREMAQHIQWLSQQPNANDATVQQRGRWLQAIIKYRSSAQATIEEYAAQNSSPKEDKYRRTEFQDLQKMRFWDYEGARSYTIQKAHLELPNLY